MDISEKLDTLAEYYSQKDVLEFRKRELLNEIQVPAEIEQIVKNGMKLAQDIDAKMRARIADYNKTIDAELEAVKIPDELKKALDELRTKEAILMSQFADVEKQRQEIAAQKRYNEAAEIEETKAQRVQLEEEINAKTAKVYADIASRKNEIEIEFSGKAGDADENIKKLEAEIKAEVKEAAAAKLAENPNSKDLSVKGKFFHAVYVKARKTWIPAKLDDYVVSHPDIKNCYTEGEPSITLRHI